MHGLSDEMVKKHILPEIRLNNPCDFRFITGDFDIFKLLTKDFSQTEINK